MHRLFYALWPDVAARARLAQSAAALDVRDGQRVRDENLHLTLYFVGATDRATRTRLLEHSYALPLAPIDLEITAAGWWRDSRVAWLAPLETPPALLLLRTALLGAVRGAGLAVQAEGFAPHVTVARKMRRAPRATGAIASRWLASDFVLVESHSEALGSRYEILRRWPLTGASGD